MIQKTEAVILRTFDFRETSKIVTFFSQEFGKLRGLLKGIRKDPRKFASHLNLGSLNEVVFYQKRTSDLHLVSQCDLKEDFPVIRKDLKKSLALSYILELVDALMPPEDKNEKVYALLLRCLKSLDLATDTGKVIQMFQIKMLSLSGFKPHFDSCLICDKKILSSAYFSHRLGGLLCLNCRVRDLASAQVLKGTIASIRHIEGGSWERASRLGLNSSVKLELNKLLHDFLVFHLEKHLKSPQFLQI
ncbi:MAG: DNA repair protein RecO [Candidatus Omnitrophota bacterium]|nr:DNA repair protein RecO [Candidatus Omnitrophota bacterium]